jgi:hypothetical protein
MVDFAKLLEATRDLTPEERAQQQAERQAEWDARMKALIADRAAKIDAACAVDGLTTKERSFLESLQRQALRTDRGGSSGGELLAMSDPQVRWLDGLAARAQASPAAQAVPGTRAYRYGRQRG